MSGSFFSSLLAQGAPVDGLHEADPKPGEAPRASRDGAATGPEGPVWLSPLSAKTAESL